MAAEGIGQLNQDAKSVLNGLAAVGGYYPEGGFGISPREGTTFEGSKIVLNKLDTPRARGLGTSVNAVQAGLDTVEALGALKRDIDSGDRLLTSFTKKVTAKVAESFFYAGVGGVALVAAGGFAAASGVAVAGAAGGAFLVANALDSCGLAPGLVGDISRVSAELTGEFIDAVSPAGLRRWFGQ